MTEHWIEVKFERSVRLRKKIDLAKDSREDVRKELAEALKKELQSIVENVSFEDFMKYCCAFSNYQEETDDGIVKGNRIYY